MKKHEITICAGAECHSTQATWLKHFEQILSPKMKAAVHIRCGNCEGRCTSDVRHAPRVKVDGRVFSHATPAEIKDALLAH